MGFFDFLTSERTKPKPLVQPLPQEPRKMTSLLPKTTAQIVAEIHNEFNTASVRSMAEANHYLGNEPKAVIEKGERLRKLGFSNAPEAVASKEYQNMAKEKMVLLNKIQEYALRYPLYKFISEEEIAIICKKYGLVFGEIRQYKGPVPEKNLLEIEQARPLQPQDESWQKRSDYYRDENVYVVSRQDVIDMREQEEKEIAAEKEARVAAGKLEIAEAGQNGLTSTELHYRQYGSIRFYKSPYKICAPLKDMNMEGKALAGHKVIDHIPDPVVLERTVNGLYRIITAWGPEAGDNLLVNPKMN